MVWCTAIEAIDRRSRYLRMTTTHIVPDTLHLFLRISDQMIYQLMKYLQDEDNIVRITEDKLSKLTMIQHFY